MVRVIVRKGLVTIFKPETIYTTRHIILAFRITPFKWRWHHQTIDQGGGYVMRSGFIGCVWYCLNCIG